MDFSANAIVEALSQRLKVSLGATLQQSVAKFFDNSGPDRSSGFAGPRGGRGGNRGVQQRSTQDFARAFENFFAAIEGAGRKRGSSPANTNSAPSAAARVKQPSKPGMISGMASGAIDKFADWWGKKQSQTNQNGGAGTPLWVKWFASKFTSSGKRKSSFTRAARLKVKATQRLKIASNRVKQSNAMRNTPGWHPAAHGSLLAARRSAAQKLKQATNLQTKASNPKSVTSNWTGNNQPDWMRWAIGKMGGGKGAKYGKTAAARAAGLVAKAKRRVSIAASAVRSSLARKGTPGWHPAAHGALLKKHRSAGIVLAQATGLQAKATSLGAGASNRVAQALTGLAATFPAIAKTLGAGLMGGRVLGLLGLPSMVAGMGAARINSLRHKGDENGQIAASMSKFDVMTERLNARNARDTGASTNWLVEQQNALRSSLQPFQSGLSNAVNWVAGGAMAAAKVPVDVFQALADTLIAPAALIAQGIVPNRENLKEHFKSLDEERKAQKEQDDKAQNRMFTNHADQWTKSIQAKQEARRNAMPKRQLKPIR